MYDWRAQISNLLKLMCQKHVSLTLKYGKRIAELLCPMPL
jgi:hypothetical protein